MTPQQCFVALLILGILSTQCIEGESKRSPFPARTRTHFLSKPASNSRSATSPSGRHTFGLKVKSFGKKLRKSVKKLAREVTSIIRDEVLAELQTMMQHCNITLNGTSEVNYEDNETKVLNTIISEVTEKALRSSEFHEVGAGINKAIEKSKQAGDDERVAKLESDVVELRSRLQAVLHDLGPNGLNF